jgi:hypothetical protein
MRCNVRVRQIQQLTPRPLFAVNIFSGCNRV